MEQIISLKKDSVINLKKNSVISLKKSYKDATGTELSKNIDKIFTGLRWSNKINISYRTITVYEGNFFQRLFRLGGTKKVVNEPVYSEEPVDLDSSVLVYDEYLSLIDKIYFGKLRNSFCTHYGDDTVGGLKNDLDNETIKIDLEKAKETNAKYLVVILNSFTHHKFIDINEINMKIYGVDKNNNKENELVNVEINKEDCDKDSEALVLGVFIRTSDGWNFKSIQKFTNEKTISQMYTGSVKEILRQIVKN